MAGGAQPGPVIHEASLAGGPSGIVNAGRVLAFDEAVRARTAGGDVVVCGDDHKENQRLAWRIEEAVGRASRPQPPHSGRAGPRALPHYHQLSRVPPGHTFYETANLRARK